MTYFWLTLGVHYNGVLLYWYLIYKHLEELFMFCCVLIHALSHTFSKIYLTWNMKFMFVSLMLRLPCRLDSKQSFGCFYVCYSSWKNTTRNSLFFKVHADMCPVGKAALKFTYMLVCNCYIFFYPCITLIRMSIL